MARVDAENNLAEYCSCTHEICATRYHRRVAAIDSGMAAPNIAPNPQSVPQPQFANLAAQQQNVNNATVRERMQQLVQVRGIPILATCPP